MLCYCCNSVLKDATDTYIYLCTFFQLQNSISVTDELEKEWRCWMRQRKAVAHITVLSRHLHWEQCDKL
jgi:hypothetical protein